MTYDGLRAPRERRPHGLPPMRPHTFKCTDEEWDLVCKLAEQETTSAGVIIRRALAQYADAPAVVS